MTVHFVPAAFDRPDQRDGADPGIPTIRNTEMLLRGQHVTSREMPALALSLPFGGVETEGFVATFDDVPATHRQILPRT